MKAYIWDLDGTLIDSYQGILSSLEDVHSKYHILFVRDSVYSYIIEKSVHEYLEDLASSYSIAREEVFQSYADFRRETQLNVSLMPNARLALDGILQRGGCHYIYTHKGESTYQILKNLGILECFTDIITAKDGFALKPEPDAVNYILRKHSIEKKDACYIGDRPLDMECAANAGIQGVFYKPEGSPLKDSYGDILIHDLGELA